VVDKKIRVVDNKRFSLVGSYCKYLPLVNERLVSTLIVDCPYFFVDHLILGEKF
jgi:hypothetical protein